MFYRESVTPPSPSVTTFRLMMERSVPEDTRMSSPLEVRKSTEVTHELCSSTVVRNWKLLYASNR